MKQILGYITISLLTICSFAGCIENDIPYPVVELQITSLQADGVIGEPLIDEVNRKVTLTLEESTDIENVNITSVAYTDEALALSV